MLYDRHGAAPAPEVFEGLKYETPNISGRMDNLRAAILRPQLSRLDAQCAAWTERYRVVADGLRDVAGLTLTDRPEVEDFVGSSFQFLLLDWPDAEIEAVVAGCKARGVELKWFGAPEPAAFTSTYGHWRYAASDPMPASDRVLRAVLDMRLPLTFSLDDCALIARIIKGEVTRIGQGLQAAESRQIRKRRIASGGSISAKMKGRLFILAKILIRALGLAETIDRGAGADY